MWVSASVGKRLHPTLCDAPGTAQSVGQDVQLPLRPEAVYQPFLAVDDVLGAGVALLGQQRREHAALRRHRVHRVLHHGQLACGDGAQSGTSTGADADGMLQLCCVKVQHAAGYNRRHKSRQRSMVPSAFANAGEGGFAQPHLEFVAEHQADDQLASIAARALAAGDCGGKNVGWVRGVLLPVDVVVVHAADHQSVGQRRRNGIHPLAAGDDGGLAWAGNFAQHFQRDADVMLLISTERTANAVEQEALGVIDSVGRKMLELHAGGPLRHGRGDRVGACWGSNG